jgi:hypothetical protein
MKNQKQRGKDRQRNQYPTPPSSARRALSIFTHEAATLFPRGKSANQRPTFNAEFSRST